CVRHQSTGADEVFERVKTPPACVPSGKMASRTSVRPAYLIPAPATASRTPESGGNFAGPAGAKGETLCIFAMMRAALLRLLRLLLGRRLDGGSPRVLFDRPLKLGIDDLDLGRSAQALHNGLELILNERCHELILHLVEAGDRPVAPILDLDDMPAEFGLDRRRDLAGLKSEGRFLEGLRHLPAREIAKIAASLSAWAIRAFFRKLSEIGAGLELLHQILGLLLRFHEDVPGAHLGLWCDLGDLLVIGGLGLRFGHGVPDFFVIERVPQRAQLVVGEALLEVLAGAELILYRGFGEKMRLHEILDQNAAARLERKPCDFRTDLSFSERELGLRDIGTVHARDRSGGMGVRCAKGQKKRSRASA